MALSGYAWGMGLYEEVVTWTCLEICGCIIVRHGVVKQFINVSRAVIPW